MKNTQKFKVFLESISTKENNYVVDAVKKGFDICFESDSPGSSEIREYMAKTFFATAWADYEEQVNQESHGGTDIMDIVPDDIPASAYTAADRVINSIQKTTGKNIETLYAEAANTEGKHYREPTEQDFGYCLAMQAMGHGVSWSDNHPDLNFRVPNLEYSYYDLPDDQYPIPSEEEKEVAESEQKLKELTSDSDEHEHFREPDIEDHVKGPDEDDHFKGPNPRDHFMESMNKFKAFLEAIKAPNNDILIESVKKAFSICFEK